MPRKNMSTESLSISVPTDLIPLLDEYVYRNNLNRSQITAMALGRFLFAELAKDPEVRANLITTVLGE